ncbi:MAG: alpha/beta fold hydrolase [Planctomycetota bacterium]|nr:alpha/beta fold hydrolase [Planctomycetota bacterium]
MSAAPDAVLNPRAAFPGETREILALPTEYGQYVGATLHRPQSAIRNPQSALLMLPGWSGPRTGPAELMVQLAVELARAGHTVLRLDLHGRGDSSGAFGDCDLDRMIADAAVGLAYLQGLGQGMEEEHFPAPRNPEPGTRNASPPQSAIRSPQSAILGVCSGANVALGLAALKPEEVGAVVALSVLPFQPSRGAVFERRRRWKNLRNYFWKALKPDTWLRLLRGELNLGRIRKNVSGAERPGAGERNLKDSARDIEAELEAWKGRALFIWGGQDAEAAPAREHFEKLHGRGVAAEAAFEVVQGANHNYYGKAWRERLAARIKGFLQG